MAAWKVSARVRMVSTKDGHDIFSCTDLRYSGSVKPAIDPIDMVINSVLSLLHLRDISLGLLPVVLIFIINQRVIGKISPNLQHFL